MSLTLTGQASVPTSPSMGKFKFYIDDAGKAYVVNAAGVATAVSPVGVDGLGASEGQVWTADGADGAGWESGSSSLSDYENVIVVDAGGNGDFTRLEAAVDATTINDLIIVASNTSEDGSVDLAGGRNIWILPGRTVNLSANNIYCSQTATPSRIWGGKIRGSNIIFRRGSSTGNLTYLYGVDVETTSTSQPVFDYSHNDQQFIAYYSILKSAGVCYFMQAIPLSSMFLWCYFQAPTAIFFTLTDWNNAPFWKCVFSSGTLATPSAFSAAAGTAIETNVLIP